MWVTQVFLVLFLSNSLFASSDTFQFAPKSFEGFREYELIHDLEKRIAQVDSDYTPVFTNLKLSEWDPEYSFMYKDVNSNRILAAFIALTEPDKPYLIRSVLLLIDPFTDQYVPNVYTDRNPNYLKYQILNKIFFFKKMYFPHGEASIKFLLPPGDFFSISYIQTFFNLQGLDRQRVVSRTSNYGVRELKIFGHRSKITKRGKPTFDIVETKALDLIETVLQTEVSYEKLDLNKISYEVGAFIAEAMIPAPQTCVGVFL